MEFFEKIKGAVARKSAGQESTAERKDLPSDIKEDINRSLREIKQTEEEAIKQKSTAILGRTGELTKNLAGGIETLETGKINYELKPSDKEALKRLLEQDIKTKNIEDFLRHGAKINLIDKSVFEMFFSSLSREKKEEIIRRAYATVSPAGIVSGISQKSDSQILNCLETAENFHSVSSSMHIPFGMPEHFITSLPLSESEKNGRIDFTRSPFPKLKMAYLWNELLASSEHGDRPAFIKRYIKDEDLPAIIKAIGEKWDKGHFEEAIDRAFYVKSLSPSARLPGQLFGDYYNKYRLYKKLLSHKENRETGDFLKTLSATKRLEMISR